MNEVYLTPAGIGGMTRRDFDKFPSNQSFTVGKLHGLKVLDYSYFYFLGYEENHELCKKVMRILRKAKPVCRKVNGEFQNCFAGKNNATELVIKIGDGYSLVINNYGGYSVMHNDERIYQREMNALFTCDMFHNDDPSKTNFYDGLSIPLIPISCQANK